MSRRGLGSVLGVAMVIAVGALVALVLQWQVPNLTLEPIAEVSSCTGNTVTVRPASATVADDLLTTVTCGPRGTGIGVDVTWLTQSLLAVACVVVVGALRAIATRLLTPQKKVRMKRVASAR